MPNDKGILSEEEICKAKVEERKAVSKIYDEYVQLLCDELNEVVSIAAAHGWNSSRIEAGEKMRKSIKALKSKQPGVE